MIWGHSHNISESIIPWTYKLLIATSIFFFLCWERCIFPRNSRIPKCLFLLGSTEKAAGEWNLPHLSRPTYATREKCWGNSRTTHKESVSAFIVQIFPLHLTSPMRQSSNCTWVPPIPSDMKYCPCHLISQGTAEPRLE